MRYVSYDRSSNQRLIVRPWQSHALTSRAIFTPLLAGNTVLLKTSEITPATQLTYAELLTAAGGDDGALNVIHVAPKDMPVAMEQVIGDRRVRSGRRRELANVGARG